MGVPTAMGIVLRLGLAFLATLPGPAWAGAGEACRDQAGLAEQTAGIPPGLLLAIGRRESGRADAQAAAILPWPWSVNREGEDHVFASQAEAVAYVAAAQRAGSRSIDVGCFQINLKYHPDAFATLEEAFDPAANAAYAARFLSELHERTGNWETAVAWYHSATPWEGEPYRDAVLAIWRGVTQTASQLMLPTATSDRVVLGIHIWEPTRVAAVSPRPPPDANAPTKSLRGISVPMQFPHTVDGLPMVITPTHSYTQAASMAAVVPTRLSPTRTRLR